MANGKPKLNDVKFTRIMYYYTELSRHNIDIDVALKYMEYVFGVKSQWIMRIVKGYVTYIDVPLEHDDIDAYTIDAFVRKLYKQAVTERMCIMGETGADERQLKLFMEETNYTEKQD